MKQAVLVAMALIFVCGVTTANAQQAKGSGGQKPVIIYRDQDIFRGPPPSPATRPYPPPRPEIGRPMERVPPLPEMKPRVGE
jgi:hypothetical protein